MRRAATAAFAGTVFAVSVAAAPLASASTAQDLEPVDCETTLGVLADPTCAVIDEVLAPVEDATGELLAPAAPGGTTTTTVPAPAPAPTSSPTKATSSSSPTAADLGSAPAQPSGGATARGTTSPRVPDVPVGSTLELGPLALPSFGLAGTTPAATADQLAASATIADNVLPAAKAAAALPDDSKATAAIMAFSMLLLAGGLLLDQVRKARLPIRL